MKQKRFPFRDQGTLGSKVLEPCFMIAVGDLCQQTIQPNIFIILAIVHDWVYIAWMLEQIISSQALLDGGDITLSSRILLHPSVDCIRDASVFSL